MFSKKAIIALCPVCLHDCLYCNGSAEVIVADTDAMRDEIRELKAEVADKDLQIIDLKGKVADLEETVWIESYGRAGATYTAPDGSIITMEFDPQLQRRLRNLNVNSDMMNFEQIMQVLLDLTQSGSYGCLWCNARFGGADELSTHYKEEHAVIGG